jgi:hypothetical protein
LKNSQSALGASNVSDRGPPFAIIRGAAAAYDPVNAASIGRVGSVLMLNKL